MNSILLLSSKLSFQNQYISNLHKIHEINDLNMYCIKPSPTIGISDIRKLKQNLRFKPFNGGKRLVIIEDFNKATIEAQNSLLKILEEPPQNTIILLISKDLSFILPTVISRCQTIEDKKISPVNIENSSDMMGILKKLIHQIPAERLLTVQDYLKTKEDSLNFIEKLTLFINSLFITDGPISILSLNELADTLKKLESAKKLINKNVNYKLTLEVLILSLPHKTHQ